MALRDLNPELRSKLSEKEKAIGLFIAFTALLFLAAFAVHTWRTALARGWMDEKIYYTTSIDDATGIKVGDPVKLMGFDVGEVTKVIPNEPSAWFNVTIEFFVKRGDYNYHGYIWNDSFATVNSLNLLGTRYIELNKGETGIPTVREENGIITGMLVESRFAQMKNEESDRWASIARKSRMDELGITDMTWQQAKVEFSLEEPKLRDVDIFGLLSPKEQESLYDPIKKDSRFWLKPDETMALGDRLEGVAKTIEATLPKIFVMTNQVNRILENSVAATSNLNSTIMTAQGAVSNLTSITTQLTGKKGALGDWLLPAEINTNIQSILSTATGSLTNADQTIAAARLTLTNANTTLQHIDGVLKGASNVVDTTDAQIVLLASNLNYTLSGVGDITHNLRDQVDSNTNILTDISSLVVSADELIRGLQKHWLLKSAFKKDKKEQEEAEETEKKKLQSDPFLKGAGRL